MNERDFEGERPSEPPPSPANARERFRARIENVIPEIVKRAVEIGVEKARESPDNLKQLVQDMKLPKEVAHYLLVQIDETKNGLFRVVAKEIRDFLEHTNFSGEVQKLLTTVQFEVNTTIRFTPNDGAARARESDKADKADKDKEREAEDRGADGEPIEDAEARPNDERPSVLPKPEVKTKVHVRRERGDRGRDGRDGEGRDKS